MIGSMVLAVAFSVGGQVPAGSLEAYRAEMKAKYGADVFGDDPNAPSRFDRKKYELAKPGDKKADDFVIRTGRDMEYQKGAAYLFSDKSPVRLGVQAGAYRAAMSQGETVLVKGLTGGEVLSDCRMIYTGKVKWKGKEYQAFDLAKPPVDSKKAGAK